MNINKDKIIEKLALRVAQLEIELATEQTVREDLVKQLMELQEATDNSKTDK